MPMQLSTSPSLFYWQPKAWLHVAGEDAAGFLQGQFTNELRNATSGKAVYGLWLNLKGRVLGDSFVIPEALAGGRVSYWIGSYFSSAETIRARLESHIIADDVAIDDFTSEWSGVTVMGEGADGVVQAAISLVELGITFQGRRGVTPAVEWLFPNEAKVRVEAALATWSQLRRDDVESLRIKAGIPAVPTDVGMSDLPNEGALEVDAISYTKGCYLGQEVMARLKSMGQVRRRLHRVRSPVAELPALPAPLFIADRKVGELRSAVKVDAAGFVGLAMLSLLHVTAMSGLALSPNGEPVVHMDQP